MATRDARGDRPRRKGARGKVSARTMRLEVPTVQGHWVGANLRGRKVQSGPPGSFWCRFRVHGAEWHVYLANEREAPQLIGCMGVTLVEQGLIFVSSDMAADRRLAVLFHEIIHAAWANSNPQRIAAICHCSKDDVPDVEESVCADLGPMLAEVVASLEYK